MGKGLRRRAGRLLWIATTPLALTLVLAAPAAGEGPGEHGAAAAAGEHGGGHDLAANPIVNFGQVRYGGRNTHGDDYDEARGDHKMPPPFLAALVNFAVLLFLVGKYAGPSFGRLVRERHETIAKQLDEAARLQGEARRKLDEYTRKLDTLDQEIARLTAEIRAEAETEKQRILADAEGRAVRLRRDAEQQIQAEIQRVKISLERAVVVAAVAMAERLLRERAAGDSDQRALADRFIQGLEAHATEKRSTP